MSIKREAKFNLSATPYLPGYSFKIRYLPLKPRTMNKEMCQEELGSRGALVKRCTEQAAFARMAAQL